ncbi:hypothetical protein [Kibdelosporangium persicum]|uniref:hypothetical protein n=1 Tax=Kibdelosporangium persicum TaxID=2698649 RepID=UPI001567128F|nr:hypothetical protein [Kibdelosporangium persicum]
MPTISRQACEAGPSNHVRRRGSGRGDHAIGQCGDGAGETADDVVKIGQRFLVVRCCWRGVVERVTEETFARDAVVNDRIVRLSRVVGVGVTEQIRRENGAGCG